MGREASHPMRWSGEEEEEEELPRRVSVKCLSPKC